MEKEIHGVKKMTEPNLMKEIYRTYREYKDCEEGGYKDSLEDYVSCIILNDGEKGEQKNYLAYWESLKKHGG